MGATRSEVVSQDPHAELERSLIAEFLQRHGHTTDTLATLPLERAAALLQQASLYASCVLSEVESRAQLLGDLHCAPPEAGRTPRRD